MVQIAILSKFWRLLKTPQKYTKSHLEPILTILSQFWQLLLLRKNGLKSHFFLANFGVFNVGTIRTEFPYLSPSEARIVGTSIWHPNHKSVFSLSAAPKIATKLKSVSFDPEGVVWPPTIHPFQFFDFLFGACSKKTSKIAIFHFLAQKWVEFFSFFSSPQRTDGFKSYKK